MYNFRAEPDRIKCLLETGVDVCNVANNHILDFSFEGMRETLAVLHENEIHSIGAGDHWKDAATPVILERKGLRVGFIGCTDNEPGSKAGVDVFHGHSAHIFQGIEVYAGGVILYDTGDFVDDYAVDSSRRNDWSVLYRLTLSDDQVQGLELIPARIEHKQVNQAPPTDRQKILHRLLRLSKPFETKIEEHNHRIFVRFPDAE